MSWLPDYPVSTKARPEVYIPPAPVLEHVPRPFTWPYKFALWGLVINAIVTNVTIWLIMDHVR